METDTLLLVTEYHRDVAVLQWPAQHEERDVLVRLGMPRLLLLEAGTPPPRSPDCCLEDWARLPVEPSELRARLATLVDRARRHRPAPSIDPVGQLVYGDARVALSPIEERLVGALLLTFGMVVADHVLLSAGWPDGSGTSGALRIHLTRLRRRLHGLGLDIRSRRGVGHLLQAAAE